MKPTLQDQLAWNNVTDENLSFFRSISIDSLVVSAPDSVGNNPQEFIDSLPRIKKRIEDHDMRLYVIQMAERCWDEIIFNKPGRDEKIEIYRKLLRAIGKAEIPVLGYVFNALRNFRTTPTIGRGGARYSTFDLAEYEQKNPDYAKNIIIDEYQLWTNFEYFLKKVIPVAEESRVRMGLHPNDPPVPQPLGGAARIFTSIESFDRVMNIYKSPNNAIEFCQGCFAEMGIDVYEAIRHFGNQDKILYVHFRNIKGNPPHSFKESFIDEGLVDMVKAMQTYKGVRFYGPFMMDHTPSIPSDKDSRIGHAYAAAYIRALLQAVYS